MVPNAMFPWVARLRDARLAHHQKTETTRRLRGISAVRLQRAFRLLLARRAVAQTQRLLLPPGLLERLHALLARTEARCASRVQSHWHYRLRRRAFAKRLALKRIEHAVKGRAVRGLNRRTAVEEIQLRAIVKLQAHQRRRMAAMPFRVAKQRIAKEALDRKKEATDFKRETRAARAVQRAWMGALGTREEGRAKFEARRLELRRTNHARFITRALRAYGERRREVCSSLQGWLHKQVGPQNRSPDAWRWRRRYFWVREGEFGYDTARGNTEVHRSILSTPN